MTARPAFSAALPVAHRCAIDGKVGAGGGHGGRRQPSGAQAAGAGGLGGSVRHSSAANGSTVRTNWTREEIQEVFDRPLMSLILEAAAVHGQNFNPREVQKSTLLSIKTGGCPETCTYCSQSSSWSKDTGLKAEKLMDLDSVFQMALRAKDSGSTRFCMGAAWRGPSQVGPKQFERVLDMVSKVRGLGMEVCTTLGMLTKEQAEKLKVAGLSCYNHNVDTSPEYYPKVTSSRNYDDRLDTLEKVRDAGIGVCSGGIIGMGEAPEDRVGMLHTLATLPAHPESVPINVLVAVEGTPMASEGLQTPTALELVRCVATARIVMPASMVRLSAGRNTLTYAEQCLCFLAGANSIFAGDTLLTTPNVEVDDDAKMFEALGLVIKPAFDGKNPEFEIPKERQESIELAGLRLKPCGAQAAAAN